MKAVIAYHEKYKQYDLGPGHPFRGDRFVNAMNFFKERSLTSREDVVFVEPEPAKEEDLLRVHDENYIKLIFKLCERGQPYDIETPCSQTILEALLLIVGGGIKVSSMVVKGEAIKGVSIGGGFHHAGRDYGGGFCIFNDIAITVEYLREKFKIKRFLIIDHDVHAGNGTSDIYYKDPTVLFISLHQDPRTIYPGTGFIEQIGEDEGCGYNVNIPLPPGTDNESYLYALKEIVCPLAEEFRPEIIISNGGSDPHFADMLGSLSITAEGFYRIAREISVLADKLCGGKYVLMPGSGYNPSVLPVCWYALITGAIGIIPGSLRDPYASPSAKPNIRREVENIVKKIKEVLKSHWTCFE